MVVTANAVAGTIGGGHLEWQAIARARGMLLDLAAGGTPALPLTEHRALGPSLGQCCGGSLDLVFEPLNPQTLAAWPEPAPWFHLQLYGAGHVGRAVVNALSALACHIDWVDERDDEFPMPLVGLHEAYTRAKVRKVCVDAVEAEVAHAPPGAFFLIMTHQHDLDLRITEAALRRGDAGFVGLIGSKTKRGRFEHRLLARGVPPDTLARLTCPVGLLPSSGALGKDPAVIAAGVAAQLLQVAQGRQTPDGPLALAAASTVDQARALRSAAEPGSR
jgi:xanthine dehydrogenase accessory factor